MDVLVSGASGLIGRAVTAALRARGDRVARLTRSTPQDPDDIRWDPDAERIDAAALEGIDGVIHLAGEPLLGRWSASKQRRIRESRIRGTRTLALALAGLQRRPRVLLSGSAVGYYGGDHGDEILTEADPAGDDFMAQVCVGWESAAEPVREAGIRLAFLRTGLVMSRDADLLKLQLPFFRLGVGGRLGDGQQWYSWIALSDHVRAQLALLDHEEASGPFNLTAPNPVRNEEFARTLGRVLSRPAVLPVPRVAVATLFGSAFVPAIAAASQRVVPERLQHELDLPFEHTQLESALRAALAPQSAT